MKLLFEKVNDYDYNNTGQFKCYYMLTTPNRDKFWQGKKFPEWELDILARVRLSKLLTLLIYI